METVKEKLAKLIEKGHDYYYSEDCKCFNVYEAITDYLIQNGVTILECGMDCKSCWKTKIVNPVQEWVSVDERLPEIWKTVLVCDVREDYVDAWEYEGKDVWLQDDIFYGTEDITHWMPLPAPPKGDNSNE